MDASSPKDLHYYEPVNGHGLRHDPFNAIIAPRPIGWISSRDAKGNINLAPYSFFNGFCYTPPIIGFSSTAWKDSVVSVYQTALARPIARAGRRGDYFEIRPDAMFEMARPD